MRLRPALALLVLGGCATGSPNEMHHFGSKRVSMEELDASPPPAKPRKAKPKREKMSIAELAKGYRNGEACEQDARNMRNLKPKKAWRLLLACANREDFTEIDRILRPPWIEDMKRAPKLGARLVSRVVANRGGNLELDLAIVNDRGVQLFDLETALDNDRMFRGRFVLMRGKISNIDRRGGQMKVSLTEMSLKAQNVKERWTWRRARSLVRKGASARALSHKGTLVVQSNVVSQETNRRLEATVSKAMPELKSGDERLFLVRFNRRYADESLDREDIIKGSAALVAVYQPLQGLQ